MTEDTVESETKYQLQVLNAKETGNIKNDVMF
jgi:hypothetical protein